MISEKKPPMLCNALKRIAPGGIEGAASTPRSSRSATVAPTTNAVAEAIAMPAIAPVVPAAA